MLNVGRPMDALLFNGWQLAKMKKSIPDSPCHKIYRDEAVGLKSCKNT